MAGRCARSSCTDVAPATTSTKGSGGGSTVFTTVAITGGTMTTSGGMTTSGRTAIGRTTIDGGGTTNGRTTTEGGIMTGGRTTTTGMAERKTMAVTWVTTRTRT